MLRFFGGVETALKTWKQNGTTKTDYSKVVDSHEPCGQLEVMSCAHTATDEPVTDASVMFSRPPTYRVTEAYTGATSQGLHRIRETSGQIVNKIKNGIKFAPVVLVLGSRDGLSKDHMRVYVLVLLGPSPSFSSCLA